MAGDVHQFICLWLVAIYFSKNEFFEVIVISEAYMKGRQKLDNRVAK